MFYGYFFDCLFIDSFCDLCPTRHHKRGATRDYSQQKSSIACYCPPVLGATRRYAGGGYRMGQTDVSAPYILYTLNFTLSTLNVNRFSFLVVHC